MKDDKEKATKFINAKRRGFMQGAAVAGVASATGVAGTVAQANELEQPVIKPETKDRYEETDYTRAYYRNARF